MYPCGDIRTIGLASAVSGTTINIRPEVGHEWIPLVLHARTDDGTARTLYAKVFDGSSSFDLKVHGAGGSNYETLISSVLSSELIVHNTNSVAGKTFNNGFLPFKLNNQVYLQANLNAITAGKQFWIDGVVIDRPENFEYQIFAALCEGKNVPALTAMDVMLRGHRSAVFGSSAGGGGVSPS